MHAYLDNIIMIFFFRKCKKARPHSHGKPSTRRPATSLSSFDVWTVVRIERKMYQIMHEIICRTKSNFIVMTTMSSCFHIVSLVAFKNIISLWWIPDTLKRHYDNNAGAQQCTLDMDLLLPLLRLPTRQILIPKEWKKGYQTHITQNDSRYQFQLNLIWPSWSIKTKPFLREKNTQT